MIFKNFRLFNTYYIHSIGLLPGGTPRAWPHAASVLVQELLRFHLFLSSHLHSLLTCWGTLPQHICPPPPAALFTCPVTEGGHCSIWTGDLLFPHHSVFTFYHFLLSSSYSLLPRILSLFFLLLSLCCSSLQPKPECPHKGRHAPLTPTEML